VTDDRLMSLPSLSLSRGLAVVVACATVGAATPGVASAATVTARPSDRDPDYETLAYYDAAPGERNDVLVTRIDDHRIRVTDAGATITAGAGCRSVDAHTADCANEGPSPGAPRWFLTAVVQAGDLDDTVRSTGVGLRADGGAGDDMLAVDAGIASELDRGGGRDHLVGGSNGDTLIDGDTSGAADSDTLEGRGGGDTVSYAGRTNPVTVDLRGGASAGEAGEADVLRSIEGAIGGEAADLLVGKGGAAGYNTLEGRGGDDVLTASAGRDWLDGGTGADRLAGGGQDVLLGGAGDDRLDAGRGDDTMNGGAGRDRLMCGGGFDSAGNPTAVDLLEPDCEAVAVHFGEADHLTLPAPA
jgi:Ca2+-binding RTX toxin-like protein